MTPRIFHRMLKIVAAIGWCMGIIIALPPALVEFARRVVLAVWRHTHFNFKGR